MSINTNSRWTVRYKLSGQKEFHETIEAGTMWNALTILKRRYPTAKLIGAVKETKPASEGWGNL